MVKDSKLLFLRNIHQRNGDYSLRFCYSEQKRFLLSSGLAFNIVSKGVEIGQLCGSLV